MALSFSNSLRGRGQAESRVWAAVPLVSRSVTNSEARVGGGDAARAGEATAFSGDYRSLAVSGRGERIEEWVCTVTMMSLHKEKERVNSDKDDSVNKIKKESK